MKSILVSVFIILLLTSSATAGSSRIGRASADLNILGHALDSFEHDVGRYPSTEEGLDALLNTTTIDKKNPNGYLKRIPNDPWGHGYRYQYPGKHNLKGYDLWSNGADGKIGGDGYDSDIGNWPGGFKKHKAAISAARLERILESLPLFSLIGLIFSGSIYLGIGLLRLSDGVPRRKSFTGKTIWIGLVFFVLYWIVSFPLMM